jgi:hypothetical protein
MILCVVLADILTKPRTPTAGFGDANLFLSPNSGAATLKSQAQSRPGLVQEHGCPSSESNQVVCHQGAQEDYH